MSAPNSVVVYVQDAVGDKWCWSASDLKYEESAKKHARWWMRQRCFLGFDGKPLPMGPCRPFKLVVERYYDASSDPTAKRRRGQ